MASTRTQRLRASIPVAAVVLVAGLLGAAAPCAPTGVAIVDHLLSGLLAAATAWAATTASPATLAIAALTLLVAGGSLPLRAIGAVLVAALCVLIARGRVMSFAAAVIAGIAVQALLRLPWTSPARGSAAVAAVGIVPILASGFLRASAGRRVPKRWMLAAAVVVGALFAAGALYVGVHTRELLDEARREARAGVDAARDGDRRRAATAFDAAAVEFRRARRLARSWWARPGRVVPVIAPQLRALDRVSSVGAEASDVAREAVSRVDPERLRFVEGRLDLEAVARSRAVFDDTARRTDAIRSRLAEMSDMWLAPPIARAITRFEEIVKTASDSAHVADDALALAPSLLGHDGARTYFVAFVTPAEARGSGGLIANYGILRASNGRIHLETVGLAPPLDFKGAVPKHLTGLSEYQARYGQYDVANTWENVTMSPDFPTVAQAIAQLYPQSGGSKVDGVIEIGPRGMAGLLALSGPLRLPGLSFALDSRNVERFLLHDEYTLFADWDSRVGLLGDIARATFDKLTSGTSAEPADISKVMSPAVRSRGLMFWLRDAQGERFVERIGADGAVPPAGTDDSFGATVQNAAGNKVDAFLQRSVRYTARIDGRSGRVEAHVVLTLRNGAPPAGEPLYVIGNPYALPPGTNRTILSLYSPLALGRARLDGRELALRTERELGRNVWTELVDIPPGGSRTIELELAGTVDLSDGRYHFDYLPQVLANPDSVSLDLRLTNARATAASPGAVVAAGGRSVTFTAPRSEGLRSMDVSLRR